ncbi:DUF3332 family protein [Psychromonas algicola]|uniref:DUF3332 family protein n=1 Tax=Psychromonas algicola TaxID=2555642 RepID=UPI0010673BD2|nr:DUF3332 family protein [Psychromonas sp. RZ5]TEW49253.1 DUF3332 family protein [Psychromonas sp. RZ5]
MKNKTFKLISCFLLTLSSTGLLSGCIGSNVATSKVLQFNLEVVENKYARGGVNVLLTPVYALTVAVDLLVFNTIEFWAGESPLNGEKHIFDSTNSPVYQVDQKVLIPERTFTSINNEQTNKQVYSVQATLINKNTVDYNIVYNNGDVAVLRGDKSGEEITFYLDGKLVTHASINDLQAYLNP